MSWRGRGRPASGVLARFDQEMARGKVAATLVTAMKGAQMGPPVFNVVPRWLLARLTGMAMASEDKNAGSSDYITMRMLAPTLHHEFALVADASGAQDSLGALHNEVLLLGGSKSPPYLKSALDTLEKVMPAAKRVEFAGLDHGASWNADRRGNPASVAEELRRFFG